MCDDEGLFTGSPFSFGQNMKQAICRKKFVTDPEAEYDNKQSDEAIAQKQHDTHADADPYEYEAQ